MPTRLQLARSEIIRLFDTNSRNVYKRRELERILADHRDEWRLAAGMSFGEFVECLQKTRKLKKLEFPFPHRKEVRYVWNDVPIERVLLTLKPNCHFSHYTAVQLHDLTEQAPTTIYMNHEQRPKPVSASGLAQDRIDMAFQGKPRTTKNIADVKGAGRKRIRVCLLNGKHTGYFGVEDREVHLPSRGGTAKLRLTDLERTLIDISVRPFYAGGVAEVIKAFERAKERLSVNRLAGSLRNLGYVYPYHQAVGFYLDASGGYGDKTTLFHDRFEYDFDFHLDYAMKETEYVSKWRIHVPRGLTRSVS